MSPRPTTPCSSASGRSSAFADLAEKLDELDLDTIDGAFFWRFCRPDATPPRP